MDFDGDIFGEAPMFKPHVGLIGLRRKVGIPSMLNSHRSHRPRRLGQLVPHLHCLDLGAEGAEGLDQARFHETWGAFKVYPEEILRILAIINFSDFESKMFKDWTT